MGGGLRLARRDERWLAACSMQSGRGGESNWMASMLPAATHVMSNDGLAEAGDRELSMRQQAAAGEHDHCRSKCRSKSRGEPTATFGLDDGLVSLWWRVHLPLPPPTCKHGGMEELGAEVMVMEAGRRRWYLRWRKRLGCCEEAVGRLLLVCRVTRPIHVPMQNHVLGCKAFHDFHLDALQDRSTGPDTGQTRVICQFG
jgi:hypothetical protein